MPDAIEAFDPPGTAEERDRRRGVLNEVYLYLRKRGPAGREDIVKGVFTELPPGTTALMTGWTGSLGPALTGFRMSSGPAMGGGGSPGRGG